MIRNSKFLKFGITLVAFHLLPVSTAWAGKGDVNKGLKDASLAIDKSDDPRSLFKAFAKIKDLIDGQCKFKNALGEDSGEACKNGDYDKFKTVLLELTVKADNLRNKISDPTQKIQLLDFQITWNPLTETQAKGPHFIGPEKLRKVAKNFFDKFNPTFKEASKAKLSDAVKFAKGLKLPDSKESPKEALRSIFDSLDSLKDWVKSNCKSGKCAPHSWTDVSDAITNLKDLMAALPDEVKKVRVKDAIIELTGAKIEDAFEKLSKAQKHIGLKLIDLKVVSLTEGEDPTKSKKIQKQLDKIYRLAKELCSAKGKSNCEKSEFDAIQVFLNKLSNPDGNGTIQKIIKDLEDEIAGLKEEGLRLQGEIIDESDKTQKKKLGGAYKENEEEVNKKEKELAKLEQQKKEIDDIDSAKALNDHLQKLAKAEKEATKKAKKADKEADKENAAPEKASSKAEPEVDTADEEKPKAKAEAKKAEPASEDESESAEKIAKIAKKIKKGTPLSDDDLYEILASKEKLSGGDQGKKSKKKGKSKDKDKDSKSDKKKSKKYSVHQDDMSPDDIEKFFGDGFRLEIKNKGKKPEVIVLGQMPTDCMKFIKIKQVTQDRSSKFEGCENTVGIQLLDSDGKGRACIKEHSKRGKMDCRKNSCTNLSDLKDSHFEISAKKDATLKIFFRSGNKDKRADDYVSCEDPHNSKNASFVSEATLAAQEQDRKVKEQLELESQLMKNIECHGDFNSINDIARPALIQADALNLIKDKEEVLRKHQHLNTKQIVMLAAEIEKAGKDKLLEVRDTLGEWVSTHSTDKDFDKVNTAYRRITEKFLQFKDFDEASITIAAAQSLNQTPMNEETLKNYEIEVGIQQLRHEALQGLQSNPGLMSKVGVMMEGLKVKALECYQNSSGATMDSCTHTIAALQAVAQIPYLAQKADQQKAQLAFQLQGMMNGNGMGSNPMMSGNPMMNGMGMGMGTGGMMNNMMMGGIGGAMYNPAMYNPMNPMMTPNFGGYNNMMGNMYR